MQLKQSTKNTWRLPASIAGIASIEEFPKLLPSSVSLEEHTTNF